MFKRLEKDHLELISWAIKNIPQEHAPGKEYAYSNFGYCLLGRIIENVSGQTYEDFVKDKVLSPSGIKMMELAPRTGALENEVTYYTKGKPVDFKMNVRRMDAHGGWVGNPTDLIKFGQSVDGFPTKKDILSKETIQTMSIREGVNPNYACGWSVNTIGNCWHGGSLPGLTSLLVRTSDGYCWAACANTRKEGSGSAIDKLMWKIVKVL
jgi:CubicO group peptidase (beta-lactamase class C family)